MNKIHLLSVAALVLATGSFAAPAAETVPKGKVKVFILAGQSNMQGKAFPRPLLWQLGQEKYRDRYKHLIKDGDFEAFNKKVDASVDRESPRNMPADLWNVRDDVWITYRGKHGGLTHGYGSGDDQFGPELNFGHVMGDQLEEPVLVIKAAWGGRALAGSFLPPSSMPSDAEFEKQAAELNDANAKWNMEQTAKIEADNKKITKENKTAEKKKNLKTFKPREIVTTAQYKEQFGSDYREMVRLVRETLGSLDALFPGYKGQGYEIAGLVWFQGWNDQYQDRWLSYEKNMSSFIRDVRKEFGVPKLPFVIGQMGHDGAKPDKEDSPRAVIKKAQAAVAGDPEFKGTVTCVETSRYWDMEADAIYNGPGGWGKDINKWRQFGDDRGYHYYGSPWFFAQVGTAFGEAMLDLMQEEN